MLRETEKDLPKWPREVRKEGKLERHLQEWEVQLEGDREDQVEVLDVKVDMGKEISSQE